MRKGFCDQVRFLVVNEDRAVWEREAVGCNASVAGGGDFDYRRQHFRVEDVGLDPFPAFRLREGVDVEAKGADVCGSGG